MGENRWPPGTANYEIIDEYPDDKYFPSYLIFSRTQDAVFHMLFDVEGDSVRVVTAYYPDPEEWESDLKTRRKTS